MAYVAFFYFDSFNLLRSSLSGSLSLLSFAYLYKKRYILMVMTALLAVGFHTSALILIVAIAIYYICYETPLKMFHKIIPFIATLMLLVLLSIGGDYINVLIADDFGGGRYEYYQAYSNGIGIFIPIKYLPAFIVVYILKKRNNDIDLNKWLNLNFVWLMVGLAIALLSYQIGMLTRVAIYFSTPFIFLLPYYCVYLQLHNINSQLFMRRLFIIYFAFMFMTTLGGLYYISEIGPFKFF